MAEYVNTHFETYVKEADLKLQILVENREPDNLGQIKKLNNLSVTLSKINANKKIWTWMPYLEKISRRMSV